MFTGKSKGEVNSLKPRASGLTPVKHIEVILVRSDICEQGQTSKPLWVGKIISTGEVLLTEDGGDLLLQIAYAKQHGSMTQPVDLTEVKQVTIMCVDFVR